MEESWKVIVFQLEDEIYGVNIQHVRSIERLQHVTKVPQTPDYVKGIINLHGDIIPVIDLKERFQLNTSEYKGETRILIMNTNDIQVGFIVDSATEVRDIDPKSVEPAPNMFGNVGAHYIYGVAKLDKKLLILLDVAQLLTIEELRDLKEVVHQ